MRRLMLNLREESARVAAREYLVQLERKGQVEPESLRLAREKLDAFDAEKIDEPCASHFLDD